MIGILDTPPEVPADWKLPGMATERNFDKVLESFGWYAIYFRDIGWEELYVRPEHYHLARAAVYWHVPALIRVDIIPMEI